MNLRILLVCCAALALSAWVATTGAAKNSPKIDLKGSSYTQTTDITGQIVLGKVQFSIDAGQSGSGAAAGTFGFQQYGCLTNGGFDPGCSGPDKTLHEVAYADAQVACLAADTTTQTVWVSARVIAADDQRIPAELLQQQQSILAQGNLIVLGRFQDTNGDGRADVRSLFLTQATTGYPNALTTRGEIGSPWFISAAGYSSAANACLQRDNAYLSADYEVANGSTNTVQWLEPDDATPVGRRPITGTAAVMANPPAASLYSLASVNRTLLSPNLKLTIK